MTKFLKYISYILLFSFCYLCGADEAGKGDNGEKNTEQPTDAGADAPKPNVVETIFGPLELEEVLFNIYNLPEMQRLKDVDQSGAGAHWNKLPKYSKLEHSLDTLWLVKNYGGNQAEQISALTHRISDAVFCEVADEIFPYFSLVLAKNTKEEIKKIIKKIEKRMQFHDWFLNQTALKEILDYQRLSTNDILPSNSAFYLVNSGLAEQPKIKSRGEKTPSKKIVANPPIQELNASSIAYILHLGLLYNLTTKAEISEIRYALKFENNRWYFTDQDQAKKFAMMALKLTVKYFAPAENLVVLHLSKQILIKARDQKRFTIQKVKQDPIFGTYLAIDAKLDKAKDLHFATDTQILEGLGQCKRDVKRLMDLAKTIGTAFEVLAKNAGQPDFVPFVKFQGVDPWLYYMHSIEFKRLSEQDEEFKGEFQEMREKCKERYRIQLKGHPAC